MERCQTCGLAVPPEQLARIDSGELVCIACLAQMRDGQCEACGLGVPPEELERTKSGRKVCAVCGAEARIKVKSRSHSIRSLLIACIVGTILCVFLLWLGPRLSTEKSPAPKRYSQRISERSKSRHLPSVGEIVTLEECNLCSDKPTYDRLMQLAMAKDHMGIKLLVLQGKVMVIEEGTRARVIDRGLFTNEVRIMSGPYAGHSGLVTTDAFGSGG